nr:helix-turn-helix transcriptional regulator [uncultured Cohaesibacter sp.]
MEEKRHLQLVEQCLSSLGQPAFIDNYLKLVKKIGAVQSTIFSCHLDRPQCLLSRNLEVSLVGEMVTAIYLSGWYKQDPLYHRIKEIPPGTQEILYLDDIKGGYSQDYAQAFYSLFKEKNPKIGLADRISILAGGNHLHLIMQFYFTHNNLPDPKDPTLQILGHLAVQHFEITTEKSDEGTPPVLSSLSDREKEVCRGILLGKKAESIAAEMEVAPSTVVTYRRRAYEKLGITSRTALFELCNG